jgi:hypothetical protein
MPTSRSKYRAVPTIVDGIRFASKKEAAHYGTLKILERAGKISDLQLQPRFKIFIESALICTYVADFQYFDIAANRTRVEDVKGMKTDVYKIKKKLVEAIYSVKIQEV